MKKRHLLSLVVVCILLAATGCGAESKTSADESSVPAAMETASIAETKEQVKETEAKTKETESEPVETETESMETEPAETQPVETEASTPGGITPEFKEMMDSYEAFFDEYVEFMKLYKEKPTDLQLMAQFGDYMKQYNDMLQKMEAVGDEELSDADMAYYIEVNARIQKKLLEVI